MIVNFYQFTAKFIKRYSNFYYYWNKLIEIEFLWHIFEKKWGNNNLILIFYQQLRVKLTDGKIIIKDWRSFYNFYGYLLGNNNYSRTPIIRPNLGSLDRIIEKSDNTDNRQKYTTIIKLKLLLYFSKVK